MPWTATETPGTDNAGLFANEMLLHDVYDLPREVLSGDLEWRALQARAHPREIPPELQEPADDEGWGDMPILC
jgi:hypothetical protein